MRAVNLIPEDERKGGGAGAAGRSGGLVYVALGGLAALCIMAALWAVTSSGLGDKRTELTALRQEAAVARARVAGAHAPADLAAQRQARTEAVKALIAQRHDWASTLDAIGRTIPTNVSLDSLDATAPATTAPGAAPAPGAAAGAAPAGPTILLGGCAPSQRAVALLMPRLRTIPGVQSVVLGSSAVAAGGTSAANPSAHCGGASFQMTLGLAAPAPATAPGTPATAAAPGTTQAVATTPAPATAAPASAPAPATSTTGTARTAVPGTPTSGGTP